MKKSEKIEVIKSKNLGLFVKTRQQVFNELSDQQTMFCCCGKLATGLHESHCRRFNDKVDSETIKRLDFLLV